MSEFQSYEFRALDRPLDANAIRVLRSLSTRAAITPTSFSREYRWGEFKGDPVKLSQDYFDVFVHYAQWGSRWCILRLPAAGVDEAACRAYATAEALTLWTAGESLLVQFRVSDTDPGHFEQCDWISRLIPLRAELLAGDLRPLYLGWLAAVRVGEVDQAATSPPVPPGLGELTSAQQALAEFLYLDNHLLTVAAAASPDERPASSAEELAAWLAGLPAEAKDAWLLRLVQHDPPHLGRELRREFGAATGAPAPAGPSVAELWQAARHETLTRQRAEAQGDPAGESRQAEEVRDRRLATLMGQDALLWAQVEDLAALKRPQSYEQVVELLKDLRDLAERDGRESVFEALLVEFRERHRQQRGLLGRMEEAGL